MFCSHSYIFAKKWSSSHLNISPHLQHTRRYPTVCTIVLMIFLLFFFFWWLFSSKTTLLVPTMVRNDAFPLISSMIRLEVLGLVWCQGCVFAFLLFFNPFFILTPPWQNPFKTSQPRIASFIIWRHACFFLFSRSGSFCSRRCFVNHEEKKGKTSFFRFSTLMK